jgi:hypothetical protein
MYGFRREVRPTKADSRVSQNRIWNLDHLPVQLFRERMLARHRAAADLWGIDRKGWVSSQVLQCTAGVCPDGPDLQHNLTESP